MRLLADAAEDLRAILTEGLWLLERWRLLLDGHWRWGLHLWRRLGRKLWWEWSGGELCDVGWDEGDVDAYWVLRQRWCHLGANWR